MKTTRPRKTAAQPFLTTKEAAELLVIRPQTLAQMRYLGTGPRYHKFGGAVRYTLTDLHAYANDTIVDPKSKFRR